MRWLAVLAVTVLAGCAGGNGIPAATPVLTPPDLPVTLPPVTTTPQRPPELQPKFDGQRAFEHVAAQLVSENGTVRYRIPGTEGNREVARYIDAEMRALGFAVTWHPFNATYGCEQVPMQNVVAERAGTSGRIVLLAAHYDTRPVADKDPDTARRGEPVLGANDAGSGVGVLLELARVLPATNDTVRFLFFDGEDGGGYKGRQCTDWILGSTAYAAQMSAEEVAAVRAMVLVDMVGDPQLVLPREGYSADGPGRALQDELYGIAAKLGHAQFLDQESYSITDDHVPFLDRRVPAVDLIHLLPNDPRVFPSWHHTTFDDLERVSPGSLDAVGETIEAWLATSRS